jgi:hypothetical protein
VHLLVAWWWYALAVQGAAGDWAFDFRQFWQGGHDVVSGVSPYPDPAAVARAGTQLDPDGVRQVFHFPYPAAAAVVLAPLGLLGFHVAAAVWSALLVTSLIGSLWILGVRDWRVLAVVVTSAPVLSSVRLGTFTPILVLLVAIAWRWRDRRWLAGGSLALAISFKLFLWPLAVWLVATRRFAGAVITAALATAITLAAWAAIGFQGLTDYPDLVRRLTDIVERQGLSLVALGLQLGLPRPAAGGLSWLVGLSLLAGVVALARRGVDERTTFSIALVASLALTPIVWLHYFALLVVPLALTRPRLSWAWALMWVFWLVPANWNDHDVSRVVLAVVLTSSVVVQAARVNGRKSAI